MRNLKKVFAGLIALTAIMSSLISCTIYKSVPVTEESFVYYEEPESSEEITTEPEPERVIDISGQTITWLADFDLNPAENNERSIALSLFEDVYGANIDFVYTPADAKYDKLSEMLDAGETVDMFPYELGDVPNGVFKNQFEPLDPYFDIMNMDSDLWSDMTDTVNMLEYKGQHYVIPYSVSDPFLITYSRNICKKEKLDDPYELYLEGKWNWDTMMSMMEKFVSNGDGQTRYGINGSFGQALLYSTGHTVVNYDGEKFTNNINDAEITKAVKLMQDVKSKNLYNSAWYSYFPTDKLTLFYAMGDWSLGESNAKNPDSDLMIVPFPKSPDADKNYICCNLNARMLVKNSNKGEAVATYIMCERLAETQDDYNKIRKDNALIEKKDMSGTRKSFITEEQYNAVQSYLDMENSVPMFDFAYGMGGKMYGEGDYTYETRGVMNNLTATFLRGNTDSWETVRDEFRKVIDNDLKKNND
ncbi:MAG: extracellular solute-binding protein [Ruminococcus sp.]|nr:extracellular solute-binding protein [Ruminococcus sp.]